MARAAEVPVHVPSDPGAQYLVLRRVNSSSGVWLLLERVAPGGVTYLDVDVDCHPWPKSKLEWSSADSLGALHDAATIKTEITRGSIEYDLWTEACITGASKQARAELHRRIDIEKQWALEDRIEQLRPQRRNRPLRAANLSDSEAREITAIAQRTTPGATVNIGSAASGCPCEDGPTCSAQVWVVSDRPDASYGLQLSRIQGHWQIGPVQQWWLDYEELYLHGPLSNDEEKKITDRFPKCPTAEDTSSIPAGP